jgi:2-keto-myo-inositol isomerase
VTAAVYLNGATLMTTATQRVLEIARDAGYRGIEARSERLLQDAAEVEATARLARPGEVFTLNGVALTLRPDGRMDRALLEEDLAARLAICEQLQAPYLLSIPPRAPGLDANQAIAGTRNALQLARDRAQRYGVKIAFEFLGFGDCPINTPELAAETVNGVEGIDLVLDSCHWHASGSQPLASYPVGWVALVHLNDAPDKPPRLVEDQDRVFPGGGIIRLDELLAELKQHGYRGPFSLETFNPEYWQEDPNRIARQGLAATSRILQGGAG